MRKDQFAYYTAQRIDDKLDQGVQKILGAVLQTQALEKIRLVRPDSNRQLGRVREEYCSMKN